jgi:predicted nuclease of predicted toxin-antitoxin system
MRLLFDQNLSSSFAKPSLTFSQNQSHVGLSGLSEASDREVWGYAKANGFTIVSQDSDFAEMAAVLGTPPKVIWLRGGNQSTFAISSLIRLHAELIVAFGHDGDVACLEIY